MIPKYRDPTSASQPLDYTKPTFDTSIITMLILQALATIAAIITLAIKGWKCWSNRRRNQSEPAMLLPSLDSPLRDESPPTTSHSGNTQYDHPRQPADFVAEHSAVTGQHSSEESVGESRAVTESPYSTGRCIG